MIESARRHPYFLHLATTALMGCAGCGSDEFRSTAVQPPATGQALVYETDVPAVINSSRGPDALVEQLCLPEFWYRMLSAPLEPEVREQIVAMVHREFSRSHRSPVSHIVRELDQALRDAGASAADTQATIGAFLKNSPLAFSETPQAWSELVAIYPENEIFRHEALSFSHGAGALPPGGVVVAFQSAAGERQDTANNLWMERRVRGDADWLPESIGEVPVSMEILVDSFVVNDAEVKPDDLLRVQGKLTAFLDGSDEVLWSRELLHDFPGYVPSKDYESGYEVELKGADVLTGQTFRVDLELEITHISGIGEPKSRTVLLKQSRSFKPVYQEEHGAQMPLGYLVQSVDQSGRPLKYSGVTSSGVVDVYRFALGLGRDVLRQMAREEVKARSRLSEFTGSPLENISLAYSPTGEADVVRLNTDEPVILIVGATWCGPCQALAPAVKELADLFEAQGRDGAKVHRFSMDDDPGSYAKELEKYPGGVLTPEQWAATGLPGVPAYIVVEGGTVSEAGILSAEKIAELKERYVGSADASQP